MHTSSRFIGRGMLPALVVSLRLVVLADSVFAQAEGGFVGQVRDESGAVLPGVTVTATSPALQVRQTADTTNAQGEYRLAPLPIGIYAVTYELQGFQALRREGLQLTVGFVAKVDVTLKIGAQEESITVSGISPVVDVTSTEASTQFTRETLQLVPTNRNALASVLVQVPGVRTTFNQAGANVGSSVRALGQGGHGWFTMEGVLSQSAEFTGSRGTYLDYQVIEEVRVQTFASDAEAATRGVQLIGVVKSGGNDFHGTALTSLTGHSLQSDNIDDGLAAQGIATGDKLLQRSDYSADLGGRVIRDKLWFYAATRRQFVERQLLDVFKPDRSPATAWDRSFHFTDKISYQMNPSNRFVTFYQWHRKYELDPITSLDAWDTRVNSLIETFPLKVEWQAVRGNALIVSLQQGYFRFNTKLNACVECGISNQPAMLDVRTQQVSGTHTRDSTLATESRYHTTGSMTWYRPGLFHGNHEFKTGFDYVRNMISRGFLSRGARGNYQLQFDNGVPFQFVAFNYPSLPIQRANNVGIYVKDNWQASRRLTINLGFRYAHDNGFVPESCREAGDFAAAGCFPEVQFKVWNTVVPRIHAAYDIGGNGKTVIKGGWGRFDHIRGIYEEVLPADPNVNQFTTFLWHDLNNDLRYQPGEVNLDVNGTDFVSRVATAQAAPIGGITVPNLNEKRPTTDEVSATLEHELMNNFSVRMSGIYSRFTNVIRQQNNLRPYETYNIPITRPDPGPDGNVGTADDPGTSFTYFEYPTSLRGAQFEQFMNINDPDATQTYKTIELAAAKRLSNRWQMSASYSATKRHIPFVGTRGELAVNTIALPFNPNSDINATDDNWEWLVRMSAAYVFPFELTTSANFQSLSGDRFARTVLFRGGVTIPSQVLNVEAVGSQSLPVRNMLDLRLEKVFRMAKSQKLAARLNLYNALNSNTVTASTNRAGASYLRPTAIVSPRILEMGVTYSF